MLPLTLDVPAPEDEGATSEYVRLHAAQRNGLEEQTVEVADILKLWVKIDSFSVVYSSDVIHIRHTPWLTLAAFPY